MSLIMSARQYVQCMCMCVVLKPSSFAPHYTWLVVVEDGSQEGGNRHFPNWYSALKFNPRLNIQRVAQKRSSILLSIPTTHICGDKLFFYITVFIITSKFRIRMIFSWHYNSWQSTLFHFLPALYEDYVPSE